MPHLTIDYSPNLEDKVDMPKLCEELRQATIKTQVFPTAGIRVRAFKADHCVIADANPKHGYIDIAVRLRGGRDLDVRKKACAEIFKAARDWLKEVMASESIALSLEMRNIDPELSPKTSTIRDHIE